MSKRQLRRFGTMVSPPDNRVIDAPHGAYIRPEPMDTSEVEVINRKGMYLRNPVEEPPFDRMRPRPLQDRQRGLGFALRPTNINEVSPGDAAAGITRFRRGQFFTQLTVGDTIAAAEMVWNRATGMATDRSSDTRPRFFHVSFFNYGAVRNVPVGTVEPLTEADIQSAIGQRPSVAMTRGRVQIHDESGGRFFDVDILGTRSFSFYAFAVTASILLPSAPDGTPLGFEINAQAGTPQPTLGPGLIEDGFAAARIVPLFQNATQIIDSITRTVEVPLGGSGTIEVPPGTTRVQLRTSFIRTVLPADYVLAFSVGPVLTPVSSLGQIFVIPGTTETDTIEVPNAKFITIVDSVIAPGARTWIATFTVEV